MFLPFNLRWPFLYAGQGGWTPYLTQENINLMKNSLPIAPNSMPITPRPIYSGGMTLSKEDTMNGGGRLSEENVNDKIEEVAITSKPEMQLPKESIKIDEIDMDVVKEIEASTSTQQTPNPKGDSVSTGHALPTLEAGNSNSSSGGEAGSSSVPFLLHQPSAFNLAQLQHVLAYNSLNKALELSEYKAWPHAAAMYLADYRRFGRTPYGKKYYNCPQCRYMTDRKNNLKRHIATMHQDCDKMLDCCGLLFKNKASLRDHVLIFHRNGYMCRFCGRNFCRKALLKRHLTVHSGQKDYVCTICDYATSHKSNLERHRKVHERQILDPTQDSSQFPDLNSTNALSSPEMPNFDLSSPRSSTSSILPLDTSPVGLVPSSSSASQSSMLNADNH